MKRFVFSLDRVLQFRRVEMERVETRLSELAFRAHKERSVAEERRAEALQSGEQLAARRELRGSDFHITRHWIQRLEAERVQALAAAGQLARQHRQTLDELIEARRKVRLLETLRRRKLEAHERIVARQLEAQASEFYLARQIRARQEAKMKAGEAGYCRYSETEPRA
jgi:hypothetical protein